MAEYIKRKHVVNLCDKLIQPAEEHWDKYHVGSPVLLALRCLKNFVEKLPAIDSKDETCNNLKVTCNNLKDDSVIASIETNLFDEVEVHSNCTVQILRNSVTGEQSVGWWENA